MKNFAKYFLTSGTGVALALALASTPAHADTTEYNKSIAKIGAQGGGFYVQFKEGLGNNCQYGLGYFSSVNMYAQILTAISTGQKLSRVDFTQSSTTNVCSITLVELTPN